MFKNLMGKIFGSDEEQEKTAAAPTAPLTDPPAEAGPKVTIRAIGDAITGNSTPDAEVPIVSPVSVVDVRTMLDDKANAHAENLDWKHSIVDMLKLLELDSSYGTRKEMAVELGYSEADIESRGSAEMNMWLHKRVLGEIAQNGGNIPDELLA